MQTHFSLIFISNVINQFSNCDNNISGRQASLTGVCVCVPVCTNSTEREVTHLYPVVNVHQAPV